MQEDPQHLPLALQGAHRPAQESTGGIQTGPVPAETPSGHPIAPPPPPPTPIAPIATLEAIRAAVQGYKQRDPEPLVIRELGLTFLLRGVTGAEMDDIQRIGGDSEAKLQRTMANFGSVEPKIDHATWDLLGQASPMVRQRIIRTIRELSGLTLEALELEKNDSSETA